MDGIEKLSLRIDELHAEIDKEKRNGNDEEARSLRAEKVALVNDRVELRKLMGQQQSGEFPFSFPLIKLNLLINHYICPTPKGKVRTSFAFMIVFV